MCRLQFKRRFHSEPTRKVILDVGFLKNRRVMYIWSRFNIIYLIFLF